MNNSNSNDTPPSSSLARLRLLRLSYCLDTCQGLRRSRPRSQSPPSLSPTFTQGAGGKESSRERGRGGEGGLSGLRPPGQVHRREPGGVCTSARGLLTRPWKIGSPAREKFLHFEKEDSLVGGYPGAAGKPHLARSWLLFPPPLPSGVCSASGRQLRLTRACTRHCHSAGDGSPAGESVPAAPLSPHHPPDNPAESGRGHHLSGSLTCGLPASWQVLSQPLPTVSQEPPSSTWLLDFTLLEF